MAKRNVFYRNNDVDAIRKLADDQVPSMVKEADIISMTSNGASAQVQIHGSTKQSRANVLAGINLKQNDHVIMIKSELTGQWIIIGGYVATTGSTTNTTAQTTGIAAPLPPFDLQLSASIGVLFLFWRVRASASGIFQVEIADNMSESNAEFAVIAGSVFPYASIAAKYFRVRSTDALWNFSSWTDWIVGTPGVPGTLSVTQGGTGQTTSQSAFDALAPSSPISGDTLIFDGTHWNNLAPQPRGEVLMALDYEGASYQVASTKNVIDTDTIVPAGNQYIAYDSVTVLNSASFIVDGDAIIL